MPTTFAIHWNSFLSWISVEYFIMMFNNVFHSDGSSLPLHQIRPSLVGYSPDTHWLESQVYLSRRKTKVLWHYDMLIYVSYKYGMRAILPLSLCYTHHTHLSSGFVLCTIQDHLLIRLWNVIFLSPRVPQSWVISSESCMMPPCQKWRQPIFYTVKSQTQDRNSLCSNNHTQELDFTENTEWRQLLFTSEYLSEEASNHPLVITRNYRSYFWL